MVRAVERDGADPQGAAVVVQAVIVGVRPPGGRAWPGVVVRETAQPGSSVPDCRAITCRAWSGVGWGFGEHRLIGRVEPGREAVDGLAGARQRGELADELLGA